MLPEALKHLHDIQPAVGLLQSFTRGKSLEDYLGDTMLRSAVERQFTIIGEAVNTRHFPSGFLATQEGRAGRDEPTQRRVFPLARDGRFANRPYEV